MEGSWSLWSSKLWSCHIVQACSRKSSGGEFGGQRAQVARTALSSSPNSPILLHGTIDDPLCSLRHLVGDEDEMHERWASASIHFTLYHTQILREMVEDLQVPLFGLAVSDGSYVQANP